MQETVSFKGIYKFDKYTNPSGYEVCTYLKVDTNNYVTCIGYNLPKTANMPYLFTAEVKIHPKYGPQYNIISFEEDISSMNIEEYLSCGIIKGIGEGTAKKIYKAFGEDSLRILEEEIDRLLEIKGISVKTVEKIKNEFNQKRNSKELSQYLFSFGITGAKINKIINSSKDITFDKLKKNPYILLQHNGITFDTVDRMALKEKLPVDGIERIEAAARYVISLYMQSGNVCMPIEEFCTELVKILNTPLINTANVVNVTIKLIEEKRFIFRKTADGTKKYIYLPHVARIEQELKNEILRIALSNNKREIKDLDKLIDKYSPIKLDLSQRQAVKDALTLPFSIITGGPGSGKTTILKVVDKIIENELKKDSLYLAPTGRAARRMAESIGKPASTIHHGLGIRGNADEDNIIFEYMEECNELDTDFIAVDEAGCVDMFLAKKLLSNISDNSRLCLVGDINQLESVKPGSVLRDIIKSGVVKVNYLKCCHRQENGSSIMENIYRIEKGISEMKTGTDFEILECKSMDEVQELMIEKYIEKVKEKGLLNVACICPFKDHKAGVKEMNLALQARMNFSLAEVKGVGCVFRVGDPVMHLINTENLNNGDIGIVTDITDDGKDKVLEVTYYGSYKQYYKKDEMENISLAYAITLHKAQGSEYPSVIFCLTKFHSRMLKRSLPYTAFSRASEDDCFIGDLDALKMAVDNEEIDTRCTMLAYDLQRTFDSVSNKWVNVS